MNNNIIKLEIDEYLRDILLPSEGLFLGVHGDIEVNKVLFLFPKYYNSIDMTEFTPIVNYVNANGDANYYECEEVKSSNGIAYFEWNITSDVTSHIGNVVFSVRLIKYDDVKILKEFNTKPSTGTVLEGLNVDNHVTPEIQETLLEKLEKKLDLHIKEKLSDFDDHMTNAKSEVIKARDDTIHAAEEIKNAKIPTKTSELENDSHFLAADTEISWGRKADTKIGKQSVALGVNVEASGQSSHAEGKNTTASGEFSHVEGLNSRTNSSACHAEGNNTEAEGYASHAEGMSTLARGKSSHAEGSSTRALGYCSHAEGITSIASGDKSHAEGEDTTASGRISHAQGNRTTAGGLGSHAEGGDTRAMGAYSHAEGDSTIARGNNQHVQGKYNVEDINNKYAHIVGNGTGITARKNIHTLDWKGNAEYAGDVAATVNGEKVSMSTLADIFLQPGAAAHNAICRGKKLGNTLTSKMLASIRDGSFNDLYVCDYIETEDNIYRFMDFDYFLECCSSASGGRIERHHAILVPDKAMSSSAIDNYPEVTQPKETHMYVNKLPEVTQTLKGIFGNDNVAMMDRIITKTVNGESTGWDWVNVGADLLTEVMVMGHNSWGRWVGFQTGIMKGQLAGFRYSHSLMCSNEDYWLRDKRSATNYALISSDGYSSSDTGSLQHGVRPFFVIW